MLLLERDTPVLSEWTRDVAGLGDGTSGITLSTGPRRLMLLLWIVIVSLVHFDRGVSAVASLDLGAWDGAVQISLNYCMTLMVWHSLGLALGGLVSGLVFQCVSAKVVLVLSLLLHASSLLALSLLSQQHLDLPVAAVLRLLSGVAASMPLAYLPLWVDEFGPIQWQTQWMALVQSGAALGQFFGAVVAGIVTSVARTSDSLDWRCAFFIQAVLLVPVIIRLVLIPSMQVDVRLSATHARMDSLTVYEHDDPHLGPLGSMMRETREMLQGVSRNPLNVAVTTALCCLHASASGVVLWSAPYLAVSDGAPPVLASLLLQATTLLLAPVAGTYAGAKLCNRLDGFKAGRQAEALKAACLFAGLAATAGPLCSCIEGFAARLVMLFIWLFGAGGFLPISAGMLMTSMPSYLRSFSAASTALGIHLVSYGLVPILMATLMSCFVEAQESLAFGVSFALWISVAAFVVLCMAYAREPKSFMPMGLSGSDDLTFGEINYELSRRRMTTAPL